MEAREYMFGGGADATELARLRMLEAAHDPVTIPLLERAGIGPGKICCDIGAGAGSVVQYMAEKVGRAGRVDAVDIDPRYLTDLPPEARLLQLDVTKDDLGEAVYDILHTRFVLIHLHQPERAMDTMWRALKPGGMIVLEDGNFHTARSTCESADMRAHFNSVSAATVVMFERRGLEAGYGLRLPSLLARRGAEDIDVQVTAPLVPGGTPLAVVSGDSKANLRTELLATGLATDADIDAYRDEARNPEFWGMYHATVSVIARKPAA